MPFLPSRMAALAAVLLFCLSVLGTVPVRAGTPPLSADERWLVLASRPTLIEATDLAANYARGMGGVRVMRSANGWFAVVTGPVPAGPIETLRDRLSSRIDIPGDAFVSRGDSFLDVAWQGQPPAVLDVAEYKGKGSVAVRSGELVVSLEPGIRPDGEPDTFATGRMASRTVFFLPLGDDGGDTPTARVALVRLDPASPLPQAVLTTYSMGAHCCTLTRIAGQIEDGAWTVLDAPRLDGDRGFAFEDLDGDGAAELIGIDQSFLYAFGPYATSFAPPRVQQLSGGTLKDVTSAVFVQPYLRRELRRMEAAAEESPDLWGENGFLGGWVATKALVGELDPAWNRMLLTHDRSPDWPMEGCILPVPVDACPERSKRSLSFPEALQVHLRAHGYPSPVEPGQAGAAPSSPSAASAPPPVVDYAAAQVAFDALPLAERYEAQTFLTALGYWPAVSSDRFNRKIYEALQAYQREQGRPVTGFADAGTLASLRSGAYPVLNRWALEPVRHPSAGARLWVPRGLGLIQTTTATGLRFSAPDHSVQIDFDFHPGLTLKPAFEAVVGRLQTPFGIRYKVLRDDFFAIAFGVSDARGYTRYHAVPGGIVGFTMSWDNTSQLVLGDRLSTVMSDLFRANVGLGLDRAPPRPILVTAPVPSTPRTALPATPPPPASADASGAEVSSTGTGFFVSTQGHLLTNHHVVDGCGTITVALDAGSRRNATVVAKDKTNDLALLHLSGSVPAAASFRPAVRLGEGVAVFGYPLTGILAAGGNFTLGNVTALAGIRDDSRMLQISAPVQPGNSGGPLLDETGSVVGVVVSKLNAIRLAAATDDMAQNVNFAMKGSVALAFLEAQGVVPNRAGAEAQPMKPADIADRAKSFTALVECRK